MEQWQIHTGSKVDNLEVIDIGEESKLKELLDEFTEWDDPCMRLIKPDNARLDLAVSKPHALVQYMQPSLEPPTLVARGEDAESEEAHEFIYNGEPNPVPMRYCITLERMKEIAVHYFNNGELPGFVEWDEITRPEEDV
jgi:hypothetical protein